jgi:succinoglycan biosynthesis protein ExoM
MKKQVSICVATYRRPEGLARLLTALEDLSFDDCLEPDVEVVVVDNDPEGSARRICDAAVDKCRWALRYVNEVRPGITYARNRAIEESSKNADFIVYIDDDEVPHTNWLRMLLIAQQQYAADVVYGPVESYFPEGAPDWVTAGKFFERPQHITGEEVRYSGSGNVLLRRSIFDDKNFKFDHKFALSGGEDTHLFLRFYLAGYKCIWSGEAVVYEWVPSDRVSARWLLRRAYRSGNSVSICEKDIYPSYIVRLIRTSKGAIRVMCGTALLPISVVRGRKEVVKSLRSVFFGLGEITGQLNLQFQEYKS